MEELTFRLLPRHEHRSDYDWMNIDRGPIRVGKVRARMDGQLLIIHSINIFPAFAGLGYGRETIERFKGRFDAIIADRVRPTAVGFWHKMGFQDDSHGNYVWQSSEGYTVASGDRVARSPEEERQ